jgi:hypothetical protein
VNCVAVRELLPELAMGVLVDRERAGVEQHLRWCAGCRKEASDLGQAAATFAFALAPAAVPQGLGDRVVARVRSESGAPGSRRRIRATGASVIAAMVAVAGLGWGAVQAGRADLFRDRAAVAEQRRVAALEEFQHVLVGLPVRVPADATYLGQLAPVPGGVGGGAALLYSSPAVEDFSIVILNGLPLEDPSALPLSITLRNPAGVVIRAGRITSLDADGGGEVLHRFARDIRSFSEVVVRDASGHLLFEGTVDRGGETVA